MPGSSMLARLLLAIGALCLLACAPAQAQWEVGTDGLAPIPKLSARVTDLTGTLSAADRQALEAKLAAWEQASGNQLVVLMVPSTKPEPIEAYSIRVAEAWKIGRKGQDNGALFLVAKDDKKMRIETGYGLEGSLTDVTARRIIAEKVAPKFSAGQFAVASMPAPTRSWRWSTRASPLRRVRRLARSGATAGVSTLARCSSWYS